MKLSIIIPTYNCEKYIEGCLDSIFNEDIEKNVEVILINDGSTDKTKEKYLKYKDKKNLIIIENENHGVSYSRNCGIKRAKGKYILFVDSDDKLEPRWYDKIQKYLDGEADILYFNCQIEKDATIPIMYSYIIGYNKRQICVAGPFSKLFKRSLLFEKQIFFKEDLINGEDMLFNVEALSKSLQIQIVNVSYYKYRINAGSATHRFDSKLIESDSKFHQYLFAVLPQIEIGEGLKKYCKNNAVLTISSRISFLPSYKAAKKNFQKLYASLFPDTKGIDYQISDSFLKKMILFLFKHKIYYIVYIIFTFHNKRYTQKVKEEYFIDI